MRIIVTVDDAYGVAFNKRRQSRDRILCEDIVRSLSPEQTLVLSPYSLALFCANEEKIRVAEDPTADLASCEIAFLERTNIAPLLENISELTVYRWNRRYPQDTSLGIEPTTAGFTLCEQHAFVGSSHEKITKEIYRK